MLRNSAGAIDRWKVGYLTFTMALGLVLLARLLWSSPNAMILSQFWPIEDIDRVYSDGLSPGSFWLSLGGEHAVTGFRWFQYLNAALFGLNTQVELFVYVGFALIISLAIGLRILTSVDGSSAGPVARLLVFAVPAVILTFVGAGSHGMEIGQYAGITAFVLLALGIESRLSPARFALCAYVLAPVITFLLLGAYAVPPALALAVVALLQFVKPTLAHEARGKMLSLTYAFIGSAAIWLALMASSGALGRNEAGGLDSLAAQISADWLYPLKYLVSGFAASVINATTLEGIPLGSGFVYLVGVIVIAFLVASIIVAYRWAWHQATVPLVLILFGPALGTSLMASRDGVLWLLGPWYGFLFRLPLVGAFWLAAVAIASREAARDKPLGEPTRATVGIVAFATAVVTLLGVANLAQWIRQPNERAYFQSVQNTILFPQELAVGPGGLTQLNLTMEESHRGIEILRKHRLGLYSNPQGVIAASSSFAKRGAFATAGLTPDGWSGSRLRVVVTDPSCTRATVQVFPMQYVLPRFASESSTLRVTSSFGPARSFPLTSSPLIFSLRPTGYFPTFDLKFSEVWNLERLGLSEDDRDLAARVALRCVS